MILYIFNTLNGLKIKGTHNAISSGMLAAKSYFEAKKDGFHKNELDNFYLEKLEKELLEEGNAL